MTIEYGEAQPKSQEQVLASDNSVESGKSKSYSDLISSSPAGEKVDSAAKYFESLASSGSASKIVSGLSIEENPEANPAKSHLNLPPIAQTLFQLSATKFDKAEPGVLSFHPSGRMLETVELVQKAKASEGHIDVSPLPDPQKEIVLAELDGSKGKSEPYLSPQAKFIQEFEKFRNDTARFGKFVDSNTSSEADKSPEKPALDDKPVSPEDKARQETRNYWSQYWKDYYGKVEGDGKSVGVDTGEYGQAIHKAAEARLGQQVWKDSPNASILQDGKIGSAASVSEILKSQGYKHATSPLVAGLAKQLLESGWKPVALEDLKPGDVIYGGKTEDWHRGGGNAHMAFVDKEGYILHNNSDNGTFQRDKIEDIYTPGTYGKRIWALRPPANGPEHKITVRPVRGDIPGEGYDYPNNIGGGNRAIADAAANSVGRRMYMPMLPYSMGRLGCAASVSGVLKEAGYGYAHHAGVYGLHKQLINNGWQKLPASEAQPGDVIVGIRRSNWAAGGGGSHIGIVGEGNRSYHNSSSQRAWISDSLSRWNTGRYPVGVFVLRPPQRA